MLLEHFQNRLKNLSISKENKFLCAVSGGIDSMVLLHLFTMEKYNFEVAHINYNLRGEDSINDQRLVEEICKQSNIPFHMLEVEKSENVNVQEWARQERFQYFKKLKEEHNFDFIALAHHDDDQLETILLSIFKGYPIQTILPKRDYFIRPLLGIDKKHISDFASANDIPFRLDQSNLESKYDRNFLRNKIIPELENKVPNFKNRILKFAERQKENKVLLESLIHEKISVFIQEETNNVGTIAYIKIDLKILETDSGFDVLSHYLLSKFEFSQAQTGDLLKSVKPEAKISNETFIAQKNLTHLFVASLDQSKILTSVDSQDIPYQIGKLHLTSAEIQNSNEDKLSLRVDYNKLIFPLKIRTVETKDKFYAFGLKGGSTDLSKFQKRTEKPSYFRSLDYIIEDAQRHIIYPGLEIDYRLRIGNGTKSCLIIDFKDKTGKNIAYTYQD